MAENLPETFRPFAGLVGIEWLDDDPDHARARVEVRDELLQPFGLMHGGVYVDPGRERLLAGDGARRPRATGMAAMGQSINVNFMRPITRGHGRGAGAGPPPRPHHLGLGGRGRRLRGPHLRAGADDDRGQAYPPKRFVIGSRRSRPNAFGVIRIPGAAWRRLYSARSTIRTTSSTTSAGRPGLDHLLAALVALDVGLEDLVEELVGRQRVGVELVGAELGRGRPLEHRGGDQLSTRPRALR